jgi:hypothetical protein
VLDLVTRLRTIRDGLHAGCTVDELTADLEVALSLVELMGPVMVPWAYMVGLDDAR